MLVQPSTPHCTAAGICLLRREKYRYKFSEKEEVPVAK
jgi:hypothetical protein